MTVIAKTLRATGNKFHIEDYQIVNGCQTSHVLFENRQYWTTRGYSLCLIATDDEHVMASIVKATPTAQTEVKEEQLIALSHFQKKLEAYFGSRATETTVDERRSRQYSAVQGIEKTRIVTPAGPTAAMRPASSAAA